MAATAVETLAGTTLGISAAAPATFDAVGYTALTFSNIGEVTDPGERGRVYALVTHQPIGNRGTQKFKGSFNEGNMTVQLAISPGDAGQILAKTALNSDASFSFKVTYQGGDIDFFQAKVMGFPTAGGGVDTIRSGSITLELTTNSAGIGIVEKHAV